MFSLSWKTVFKQSRHLPICRALKLFLIAISIDPRQLGGSIEKVPGSSIASRQLVDRLSFCSCVFALFLDTFSTAASVDVVFLDTFFDRCLNTSWNLYLSRFTEHLYIGFVRSSFLFHLISLSIVSCFLFPNLFYSLQTYSSRFLQAFTSFSSLGKLRISLFHAFSCFET